MKLPGSFIVETYYLKRLILLSNDFIVDYKAAVLLKCEFYTFSHCLVFTI